jgi:hypothetical protein
MYFWAAPGARWNSAQVAGPGTTFSAPAIAVRSTGEADVVAAGGNATLMYYWAAPGSQWKSSQIAGWAQFPSFSAPSIAVRSTGEGCAGMVTPASAPRSGHKHSGSENRVPIASPR